MGGVRAREQAGAAARATRGQAQARSLRIERGRGSDEIGPEYQRASIWEPISLAFRCAPV
eukprot:5410802-Prymnesium_polylepis.2